jgi:hypothetical protein
MALPRKLTEEFNDFSRWWNYHAEKVMTYPPERRQEFLLNAINQQNYLLVELARAVNDQRDNAGLLTLPKLSFGGRAP